MLSENVINKNGKKKKNATLVKTGHIYVDVGNMDVEIYLQLKDTKPITDNIPGTLLSTTVYRCTVVH